eukprot:CAMPEP_0204223284 /NCGR_PEP_ID=MMETSP0361-20130328/82714_1 /ASSEMBLY_ACC=CAM_ASM_000343 /TAXON_ID=268821 /ORGANISM="Scrippsiella Hangoei, Strain SHTV-5" /LENGTH=34 /DNA_ID= /DNA_START= /DNA_END= /DNA_ORIENTATION=
MTSEHGEDIERHSRSRELSYHMGIQMPALPIPCR